MKNTSKNERIWELDALRGTAICCVILLHFLYDLQTFLGLSALSSPVIQAVMQYGGIVFVVLSGLCATLGSRSLRRGALVFACGMVITAVTMAMVQLGLAVESLVIRFGVLHLLGICMLLWPVLKKLPTWLQAALGVVFVALGMVFDTLRVKSRWLFPLGLRYLGFTSSDYFPLFPHLGWFLLGAAAGRTLYGRRQTRLPNFPSNTAPVRFFRWCGTHSLWLYLLHQPILYGLVSASSFLLAH